MLHNAVEAVVSFLSTYLSLPTVQTNKESLIIGSELYVYSLRALVIFNKPELGVNREGAHKLIMF